MEEMQGQAKQRSLSRHARRSAASLATIPALLMSLDYASAAYAADADAAAAEQQQGQPTSIFSGLAGLQENLTPGGFVRTWPSVNLQNHPETSGADVRTLQILPRSPALNE